PRPPPRSPLFPYTTLFRSLDSPDPRRVTLPGNVRFWPGQDGFERAGNFIENRSPPGQTLAFPGSNLQQKPFLPFQAADWNVALRSEEHTSELQSPYDLVCR